MGLFVLYDRGRRDASLKRARVKKRTLRIGRQTLICRLSKEHFVRIVHPLRLIATATLGLAIATASSAPSKPPVVPAPGDGLFCSAMFLMVAAEVGRRCFPEKNAVVHAELERSIALINAYVLRNSSATKGQLAEFRSRQGGMRESNEQLCQGERLMLYNKIVNVGADTLRTQTATLIARPGKPTWGHCL